MGSFLEAIQAIVNFNGLEGIWVHEGGGMSAAGVGPEINAPN